MNVSDNEKVLTDAYYWLSMYKSGAVSEDIALERVKGALFDQPQLNDNQQIVLEWFKANVEQDNASPMCAVFFLGEWQIRSVSKEFRKIDLAYCSLDSKQQAQVLQVFSQWALEQENE